MLTFDLIGFCDGFGSGFLNTLFKTAMKTNRAKPVQSQIAPNTQLKSALSIDYQN